MKKYAPWIIGAVLLYLVTRSKKAMADEVEGDGEGGEGTEGSEAGDTDGKTPFTQRDDDEGGGSIDGVIGKAGDVIDAVLGLLDNGDPEPVSPIANDGSDPYRPLDYPSQGTYYRVQDGDSPIRVVRAAGLADSSWRKMRDHGKNAWLPKRKPNGSSFIGTTGDGLPFYRWFTPSGYQTECHFKTQSGQVFPVIWIPSKSEVS